MTQLVWSSAQERRAWTPVLDQVNDLMDAIERGGALPVRVALGRRQALALPDELAVVRAERVLRDPLHAGDGTLWGVPVEYVDADDHLAVAREARG